MKPTKLDVAKFAASWDLNYVWGIKVTDAEIETAILQGRLIDSPLFPQEEWTREQHIERIAWLVLNPATDPIEVDVGIPFMGFVPENPIQDGNLRFAAALYRKDPWILATLSGQVSVIKSFTWRK